MSLRSQGKQDLKKYYDIKMKKVNDWRFLLESIIATLILFAPVILAFIQLFYIYGYNIYSIIKIAIGGWLFIILLNAVSNYLQIRFAQAVYKKSDIAQSLNAKAVFVYQLTNIGFIIFIFVVIFIFLIMFAK